MFDDNTPVESWIPVKSDCPPVTATEPPVPDRIPPLATELIESSFSVSAPTPEFFPNIDNSLAAAEGTVMLWKEVFVVPVVCPVHVVAAMP